MPLRALIVEDSRNMQSALQDLLNAMAGLEVIATAVGEAQATDWIYHHRNGWELAVVDLLLQDGSGFHLVHRLKSEHAGGHVVVFSEFATPALKAKCLALGADAVFLKSDLAGFVAHVEQFAGPHACRC